MRRILFCLIFYCDVCSGQHQDRGLFIYNVGFGGLTSSIGSIFNTPKGGNWKRNFIRSFWQGCIGGALHYSGKKTVYLINKDQCLAYAWPAKILHAAGSSIIENAAVNGTFLNKWSIEIGPARLDYDIAAKKLRARFLPMSIYSCISGFITGNLDAKTTLLTGTFVFTYKNTLGNYLGISYGRGISYIKEPGQFHTIAHEIVHGFQFSEYQVFNTWLQPLSKKVKSNTLKQIFNNYVYFDMPYFFASYYGIEGGIHTYYYYYRNFYEFEAERFAINSDVPIH